MKILLSALCLTCLVPSVGAQGQTPQGQTPQGQTPPTAPSVPVMQAEGDFYVLHFTENPKERLNLEEFVMLCQEATGLNFTYDQQTQDALQQTNLVMFGAKR